jgi:hypothetical protein
VVARVDQIDMIDNVIIGDTSNRVLDIFDVLNMRIRGGYIEGNCDRLGAESAVQIRKNHFTMSNVSVQGVTIKQAATTTPLDVLKIHNFRQRVSVIGCTLIGNGIRTEHVVPAGLRLDGVVNDGVTRYGITASANIIKNNHYGIILRSLCSADSATLLDSVNLSGNTFFDDQATPSQTWGILLTSGNHTDFIQNGTLTVSGNTFGRGITTTIQNDANVNRYATSGQGANNNAGVGGTMWWVRTGAPTFSAPNGDIAIRADGGAGSTFYVREGGSWVAK